MTAAPADAVTAGGAVEIRDEPLDSPASRALRGELLALYRARLGHEPPHDVLEAPGDVWAWLLACSDGEPIGCGMLVPPGELRRMYVRPRWRGRGTGRALLAALEARARAMGAPTVSLLTTEPLLEARALYRSAGYRVVAARGAVGRVDLWMAKRLG